MFASSLDKVAYGTRYPVRLTVRKKEHCVYEFRNRKISNASRRPKGRRLESEGFASHENSVCHIAEARLSRLLRLFTSRATLVREYRLIDTLEA